jgi:putative endonuclease
MSDNNTWTFYLIYNKSATYAGISNDYIQRLRKHNGEISGGAKYTASKGSGWKHLCIVTGFQTKNQALMFEWAVKHVQPRNAGGITSRIKKLYTVLNKKNWTSKSPEASTVPLLLEWKTAIDFTDIERNVPDYVTDISFAIENIKM